MEVRKFLIEYWVRVRYDDLDIFREYVEASTPEEAIDYINNNKQNIYRKHTIWIKE